MAENNINLTHDENPIMETNEKRVVKTLSTTNKLSRISMLGAVAFVLSLLSMPLPIFVPFLKIDIADVPAVFASIIMGPLAGIVVQLIKNIIAFIVGSSSYGVGELANFLMGSAMVIPIGIIFKKNKSNKSFIIGAILSILLTTIFACIINYTILLPMYAKLFNTETSSFVAMGGAIIPFVDTMWEFLLFSIAPFNIFKGVIVFSISYGIYSIIKYDKV